MPLLRRSYRLFQQLEQEAGGPQLFVKTGGPSLFVTFLCLSFLLLPSKLYLCAIAWWPCSCSYLHRCTCITTCKPPSCF